MNSNSLIVLTATLMLAAGAKLDLARGEYLRVGDAAPALQVSKWVQGEPVHSFERDKAYVVEFWATWCGPCRTSIPHLNALHTQFKDKGLIVIGQDVWERDTGKVAPFIKQMGDQMTYRVALDLVKEGDKGQMALTWMEAAGQNGIPTAFVVDRGGRIAWIGHPMGLKEEVIERVLDGSYDLAKAAAAYKEERRIEELTQPLWKELSQHRQKKEWDEAEAVLARIEALLPEDQRENLGMTRFYLLLDRGKYKDAYALASRLNDAHQDEPMYQNELAWDIATKEGLAERDLDLAEKIARQANESTQGKNAEIVDTLARVLYMKGGKEEAIELQRKAVGLAEGKRKDQFQETLDSYKAGREPKAY